MIRSGDDISQNERVSEWFEDRQPTVQMRVAFNSCDLSILYVMYDTIVLSQVEQFDLARKQHCCKCICVTGLQYGRTLNKIAKQMRVANL